MTVAQLILKLQAYNGDLKVFVDTDNGPTELVDYFETDSRKSKSKVDDTLYLHIAEESDDLSPNGVDGESFA